MKLDYIKIGRFKNLSDFICNFDETNARLVTVLLGRNGSGKSNLLEALVIIFRDLFLGKVTDFAYELGYTLRSGQVEVSVSSSPDAKIAKERFTFRVRDGDSDASRENAVSRSALKEGPARNYLPRHVFAYYSGPSDRLEEHFRPHQKLFYKQLLKGYDSPFRPLFYARPVHSNFVLLAFFTKSDEKISEFLRNRLRIVDLDSVLFILRKPDWKGPADGDARFWHAAGTVRRFLSKVYDHSLGPILNADGRIPNKLDKTKRTQFAYLFIAGEAALQNLAMQSTTPSEFFKELESTYISDLIHETRIRVRIVNCDDSLTFRELSEGEQQLLTVVGLLRFSRESDALFLLDEPDTHLNPVWGMEYLQILRDIAEPDTNSQVLMATHDPLVVAGLKKEEVIVLDRNESTGMISASHPDFDPQGLGVSGILRSSMFGLRTTLDLPTQAKLDDRFALVAKGSRRTDEEDRRLRELSEELASAGFATDFRDTNFGRYAQALGKIRYADKVALTPSELEEVDSEALAAVEQILAEDKRDRSEG
jgi:predicted ATPase